MRTRRDEGFGQTPLKRVPGIIPGSNVAMVGGVGVVVATGGSHLQDVSSWSPI